MAHHQSDFCAVGAVYAGLTAAYRIHQAGHSVTVFEAGPRGGGRTWSAKLSNGALFEIDGQWVGDEDAQPDVRRLMDEFGIEVYGQWDRGKTVFVDLKNNIHTYDAHDANPLIALPPISMAAKLDLSKAILSMEKMSEVVNPEAPWDDVRFPFTVSLGPGTTREADQMTVQSWFNLNIMTKEARALLGAAIVGYTGVELAACSLLHWLFVLKIYRSKLFNMSGQAPGQAQQCRAQSAGSQRDVASLRRRRRAVVRTDSLPGRVAAEPGRGLLFRVQLVHGRVDPRGFRRLHGTWSVDRSRVRARGARAGRTCPLGGRRHLDVPVPLCEWCGAIGRTGGPGGARRGLSLARRRGCVPDLVSLTVV